MKSVSFKETFIPHPIRHLVPPNKEVGTVGLHTDYNMDGVHQRYPSVDKQDNNAFVGIGVTLKKGNSQVFLVP